MRRPHQPFHSGELIISICAGRSVQRTTEGVSRANQRVRVLLATDSRLLHGDVLFDDGQEMLVVNLVPEMMVVVGSRDARIKALLALELGNLHWPTQIEEDEIIFPEDGPAMAILEKLGLEFTREERRFMPAATSVMTSVALAGDFRVTTVPAIKTANTAAPAAASSPARTSAVRRRRVTSIGFGIDGDLRRGVVQLHVLLADVAAVAHRLDAFGQAVTSADAFLHRSLADERERRSRQSRRPKLPNIGRMKTGCGVGIEALGSPICDQAMTPPLITISGLTPKNAGFHSTRSASLPTSIEPTRWPKPWAMAGLIVYLAM